MTIRQSFTAVVDRNQTWVGPFASEPYEVGWATEAVFFVRVLKASGNFAFTTAEIQISPDGMHWCDEGTQFQISTEINAISFGRVTLFGNWLRIMGELPPECSLTVMVYLSLKE